MLGVLALLAADRDEPVEGGPARRTELVLAEAGFAAKEKERSPARTPRPGEAC